MLQMLKRNNFFLFELFIMFRLCAWTIASTSIGMLGQDKICLITFKQSPYFCQNIQNNWNTTAEQKMRDQVLAEGTKLSNYRSIIDFLPMLTWSMFVGSFLDQSHDGVFVVMALQIVGGLVTNFISLLFYYNYHTNPYLMLFTSAGMFFSGGMVSFVTTAYRYFTVRTPEEERAFKFLIIEVLIVLGIAGAIFLGGMLVMNTDLSETFRLRTYHYDLYIAIGADSLTGLLTLILYLGDKKPQSASESENKKNILSKIFDIDNVRQTFSCFFKRRPHNIRTQVIILYLCLFATFMVTNGSSNVMMAFVQKVYHWGPSTATSWTAIKQIVSMVLMGVFTAILVKWLKVKDSYLVILSQASSMANDIVVGSILHPMAYYISLPIGSLAWLGMTAIRAKISKIIPEDEIGKVLSFSSTVDAVVPFAATLIYNNIFAVSISSYPGAIYHFGALLMLIGIVLMIAEIWFCPVTSLASMAALEDTPNSEKGLKNSLNGASTQSAVNEL